MKEKMKCFLQRPAQACCASTALLILRLIVGTAFVLHGWGKIQNPMGWMGPESPVPGIFQFLAALSEFGGGIAWILGLLTSLFSLGIGFTMAVAIYFHMFIMGDPFVNMAPGGGAFELPAAYFAIAILLFTVGPGKFSADAKVFGSK